MRKTIFALTLALPMAGMIFTGCQTNSQKEEAAETKVENAKQELKEVRVANAEEWKAFKDETDVKIKRNEDRIAELKEKKAKPGKTFDAAYDKKIDLLEERNNNLKAKRNAYENNQSDWDTFYNEFDKEMKDLDASFDELFK